MTKQMKRLGTLCLLLMLAIVSQADGFKDFSVIVNDQKGTLLTAEEQVQGTAIDFYVDAVDGVTTREIPADGTAAGHVSGKFHSEHGCTNLQVQAYEASNVKITVGQCTYSPATITVTDAAGNVVATKTPNGPGCWKNDKNNADVLYYTGEATTLTITGMDYCPFVAVSALTEEEIAALNAEYTLSYFDYDGTTLIGTQLVKGQDPIGEFAFGADDVTPFDGGAFRGWFDKPQGGKKYKVEDIVEGDMSLYAVATAIEHAFPGVSYSYNLADPNFDPADHECIDIIGDKAYYHDASHGWAFYNDEKINLTVAGDATITIVNCQYGNGTNIAVVDTNTGETIGSLPAKSDADGGVASFEYEGGPTVLSLVMESGGEMYLHSVAIANKSGESGEHEPATLDNEPVSAFFDFGLGIDGQKADFGEANDYFVTSKVTYGSNLSIFGARQDQTQCMPETQQNEEEGGTAAD